MNDKNPEPNPADQLTKQQIAEYREAFSEFDREGTNKIPAKNLGLLMQTLGYELIDAEIEDMISQADPETTGIINFESFLGLMVRKQDEELMEVFKVFTNEGRDTIEEKDFKKLFEELGEKIDEDEFNEMMRLPMSSGSFTFTDFCKIVRFYDNPNAN